MKHKKFIELLNLYLDGEIDDPGISALEREILRNPGRREIFNDYCRIHRASKMVYERFRMAASGDTVAQVHIPTVRRFAETTHRVSDDQAAAAGGARSRPFRAALYLAGGIAAACGALLLATQATTPGAKDPGTPVVAETPATVAPSPGESAAVTTYAAPFAAQLRADPFVVELPNPQRDPFAMASWSNQPPVAELGLLPPDFPALHFSPVDNRLGDPEAIEDLPTIRVFRQRVSEDQPPPGWSPVGMEIQR